MPMTVYLQDLLVLLGMRVLHLLGCTDVVLEVATSMLPCLEALKEELCNLCGVSTCIVQ